MDVDDARLCCSAVVQTMTCAVDVFLHSDKAWFWPRNNSWLECLRLKLSGSVSLYLGSWPSMLTHHHHSVSQVEKQITAYWKCVSPVNKFKPFTGILLFASHQIRATSDCALSVCVREFAQRYVCSCGYWMCPNPCPKVELTPSHEKHESKTTEVQPDSQQCWP